MIVLKIKIEKTQVEGHDVATVSLYLNDVLQVEDIRFPFTQDSEYICQRIQYDYKSTYEWDDIEEEDLRWI